MIHTSIAAGQFTEVAAITFGTVLPSSQAQWLNVIPQEEKAKPKGFWGKKKKKKEKGKLRS